MKNLKDYRDRELPLFIIANVLVFLIVHNYISVDIAVTPVTTIVVSEIFSSIVLSAIAFGFILAVECLFTSDFKERLLYLFGFFGYLGLPGYTIFSNIKNKNRDNRFSYNAEAKYSALYKDMPEDKTTRRDYENKQWYLIYSSNREVSLVYNSQRDWLLCRDIYISSLLMIAVYVLASIFRFTEFNGYYSLFLLVMVVVTNIGANRKAVRFAYNVIAYDVTKPSEKEKKA